MVAASLTSDLTALINQYRSASGLRPLAVNVSLTGAAAWMAGDMAVGGYISHTSSDGRSPAQRMAAFGYPAFSRYTGEDLAAGQTSAAGVIAGWKASPAHNAVLLNPNYDSIGIGYATNAATTYKTYWAADFGGSGATAAAAPAPVVAAPVPTVAPKPAAVTTTVARAAPLARGIETSAAAPPAVATIDAAAAHAAYAAALREARIELWIRRVLLAYEA